MLKLFKKFSKKDVLFIIISIIMIIAQVYLDLKTPDYMSEITQLVKTQGSQMSDIWKNGSMMLVCSLGSLILTIITGYLVANVAANLSKNIRKENIMTEIIIKTTSIIYNIMKLLVRLYIKSFDSNPYLTTFCTIFIIIRYLCFP